MKKTLLAIMAITAVSFSSFAQTKNALSPKEKKEGYKLLFDGKTTDGWHSYLTHDAGAWHVVDGSLQPDPAATVDKQDLVTNKEYTNYELKLDWKIPVGGNSGVIFSV